VREEPAAVALRKDSCAMRAFAVPARELVVVLVVLVPVGNVGPWNLGMCGCDNGGADCGAGGEGDVCLEGGGRGGGVRKGWEPFLLGVVPLFGKCLSLTKPRLVAARAAVCSRGPTWANGIGGCLSTSNKT
jgi:hypothetical protein